MAVIKGGQLNFSRNTRRISKEKKSRLSKFLKEKLAI